MSDQSPPDDEDISSSLSPDQLREYVQDVMDWTAYQAAAYVAVVRNGPVDANDIVAMTDIPQGRVYDVLGQLEGEAVNVQGIRPKRFQARHPRSLLGDKQKEFNDKADAATDHLEQQHEIQRERHEPRHPAWVIPGISGTKRELSEGVEHAEEQVLLLEQDGSWIQSNEVQEFARLVENGVHVEVIGWSGWRDQLEQLVEEAGICAWIHEQVDSSFGIFDDDLVIMKVGRGRTGIKIEDSGAVSVLRKAFEVTRQDATDVHSNA